MEDDSIDEEGRSDMEDDSTEIEGIETEEVSS